MNIERHMATWRADAIEDMAVTEVIFQHGRYSFALFTAHLAIEKILKVHVMAASRELPPRIHNLTRLATLSGLKTTVEQDDALRRLEMFQIIGRYPGSSMAGISREEALARLNEAKELFQWLNQQ